MPSVAPTALRGSPRHLTGTSTPAPAARDHSGQNLSLRVVSKSHRCPWFGGPEAGSWCPVPGSTETWTTAVLPLLPPQLNNDRRTCLHADRHIYTYLYRTPLACPNPSFPQGSAGGSNSGGARSRPAMPSHHGRLHEAPLARALAAEAEGGGVALLADGQVARRPRLQVARGAAEEAPHQVVEEVPRVQHVDPGVAAAVEAGQEHGDDEGGGCKAESMAASGHGTGGENHHLCREPQLCRHRDASSRAREGLPCPQEHLGQYIGKEELPNKKGGAGLSLSNFVFRFFPPEELCSPTQLRRCRLLGITLEMPWEEAELPPAPSAPFASRLPEAGRREHGLPELP